MSSQENSGMERVKTSLPPELDEAIEDLLDYGDSKSAWVREAIRMRLESEQAEAEPEDDK